MIARVGLVLLFWACGVACAPAGAQEFPNRPVTMVVPFSAGGPGDIIGRLLGPAMGAALGPTIVVENAVGAGGTIGTNRVAKAAPDGYTILLMHVGQATSVTLFRKLPYDPVEDFAPIGLVTDAPMIIVAPNDFPGTSFAEAIAHIKANPDRVLLGNAGIGSASHLCGLLLMDRVGTKLTTVQYRGGGPALIDVMAGRLNLWCDPANGPTPYVQEGKMKALAVSTLSRLPNLPEVPTADEAGLKGFDVSTWYGLYAPRGTPPAVIDRLLVALRAALRDQTVKERFVALSLQPIEESRVTPEALRAHLVAEVAKWAPVIRKAGVFAD
ncbi:tripartite tricarboxylate transporter substrate-binding protein [uncultured Enterovirga sp.]|uniref:tripartite tricarboxylate transporter substrate-binding protein n=1 Tax=uncultured Enterovirga sp. TaxID=2026352 RepID=UPI0035CB9EBF